MAGVEQLAQLVEQQTHELARLRNEAQATALQQSQELARLRDEAGGLTRQLLELQQARPQQQVREARDSRTVTPKHMHCEKFSGNFEAWDNWAFTFKTGVGAQSKEPRDAMVKVERDDTSVEEVVKDGDTIQKASEDIYVILAQ